MSAAAPGYDSASQQVTLTTGSTPTIEIRLESLAGSLEGQVTDVVSGAVLPGATVALAQWTAVTDAAGRYRLEGVPPGEYVLQVSLEGYGAHQQPAMIEARGSHHQDVMLAPIPGLVKVRVVDAATGRPIEGAVVSYVTDVAAPVQADQANEPCADYALLVPLKRSREYRAVRARVSDPRPSDAWQEDGLHFFVFSLTPDGADGEAPTSVEPPVAVFVMRPGVQEPVSAVVVRPRPDGQEAEVIPLGEADSVTTPAAS